jgi:hypothetical protein
VRRRDRAPRSPRSHRSAPWSRRMARPS